MVPAVLFLATGCGDDEESKGNEPSEQGCKLDIQLSGAVDFESSPSSFSCGFATLLGSNMLVFFLGKESNDIDIDLTGAVGPGEAGTVTSIQLGIAHSDGRSFDAFECQIDVTENSFVRSTSNWDEYHLEGSGSCSEPATSDTGESVTVSPFEFVANAGWEPGTM
jgi:hypothetical protein